MREFERRGGKRLAKRLTLMPTFSLAVVTLLRSFVPLPLRDGFGIAESQLDMVNFDVEGIDRPICCPKVDLAEKKRTTKKFVRIMERKAVLSYDGYSALEHE